MKFVILVKTILLKQRRDQVKQQPEISHVNLCVAVPPAVEPEHTEIRQALGRAFSLTCRLLRAHPARLLRYEWKLGTRLLTVGQFSDQRDDTNYHVRALNREGYGEYTCDITNEAGAGRCTFLVTGELYYSLSCYF